MKRDMELIRKLLMMIEDSPDAYAPEITEAEGYSSDMVDYHKALLVDAGLVVGSEGQMMGKQSPCVDLTRLSWAGHEFLDAAKEDTRWNKAMKLVRDKGGAITFEVLKALLTSLMKTAVGLGPRDP